MIDQTINICLCNLILNVPASQIPILFHPDLLPRYCACTCCLWVDFSIYKISHTFVFHSDSVECFPLENSFGVRNWSILSILKNDQEQLSYFKFWWKLKQGSVQGTYVFVKMFNGGSLEVDYSLHAFFLLILNLEEERHILYTILTIQMGVWVALVRLNLKNRKASAWKVRKTEKEQKNIFFTIWSPSCFNATRIN